MMYSRSPESCSWSVMAYPSLNRRGLMALDESASCHCIRLFSIDAGSISLPSCKAVYKAIRADRQFVSRYWCHRVLNHILGDTIMTDNCTGTLKTPFLCPMSTISAVAWLFWGGSRAIHTHTAGTSAHTSPNSHISKLIQVRRVTFFLSFS
ncbi:hypothetical protein LZ32DRAFT_43627 [Colletotrichum eremochloae]|nr:hypothetical protein LZ32DRAFT_43627 [Colletotrichum eremochloae]